MNEFEGSENPFKDLEEKTKPHYIEEMRNFILVAYFGEEVYNKFLDLNKDYDESDDLLKEVGKMEKDLGNLDSEEQLISYAEDRGILISAEDLAIIQSRALDNLSFDSSSEEEN
ncbi:MAG: hypothetical protein HY918_01285 [Candidatus Doudnabacteria bacterium]|nr:hypothetical protein [Candidatus Doudnabacteria bacterium]